MEYISEEDIVYIRSMLQALDWSEETEILRDYGIDDISKLDAVSSAYIILDLEHEVSE